MLTAALPRSEITDGVSDNAPHPDPLAATSLRNWLDSNGNPDFLLRGVALREVEESNAPEYSTIEGRQFLLASSQQEQRRSQPERQRERYLTILKAKLSAEANKAAADSLYKHVTAQTRAGYLESVRLAVDAMGLTQPPTKEAVTALRRSLLPEPYPIFKHKGFVHQAMFSRDGSKILTASSDKTTRIRDGDVPVDETVDHMLARAKRLLALPLNPNQSK